MSEILKLRGAPALSAARLSRLAESLREPCAFNGLAAEHWYFVETDGTLSGEELARLKELLGIPATPPAEAAGKLILVTPRLGTISPWASKATDIAHNCGFAAIKRIERGVATPVDDVEMNVVGATESCCRQHDRRRRRPRADRSDEQQVAALHN